MKMNLLPPFLLFCFILLTHAQRRTTTKPTTEADITKPTSPRGRGRSRFVASEEFQGIQGTKISESSTTRRTVASRRRVVENVEQRFPSRTSSASNTSKQPSTVTPSTSRRFPSPTFNDTVEKIFTVTENTNKRFQRPQKSSKVASTEDANQKISKPLTEYVERRHFKNAYEVQEIVDDDFEIVRRSQNPRILTENNFRTTNILSRNKDNSISSKENTFPKRKQQSTDLLINNNPKRNKEVTELSRNLNIPTRNQENIELSRTSEKSQINSKKTPELEANIPLVSDKIDANVIEEKSLDITQEPSDLVTPDPLAELVLEEDITKVQISTTTTTKPAEPTRSQGTRRNGQRKSVLTEPSTPAPRFRTRSRNSQSSQAASASQTSELYLKAAAVSTSAPGRGLRRRHETVLEPRKGPSVFPVDSQFQETRSRTGRKIDSSVPEKVSIVDFSTRNRYRTTTPKTSKTTFSSRNRFRTREMPIIDEQKLEVLPLFEEEPKLVQTRNPNQAHVFSSKSRKRVTFNENPIFNKSDVADARSRRRGTLESMQTSASEKDKTLTEPTELPARSRVSVTVNTETRADSSSSFKRFPRNKKPQVKESVVSEVNEVTTRRKVSRKKVANLSELRGSRGSVKSDVVKKGSSEEVGESDNYPEEFKALIKAKNEKKINENENELKPKTSTSSNSSRSNRKRFTTSSTANSIPEVSTEEEFNTRTTGFTTTTTPSTRVTKLRTFKPRSFGNQSKVENTSLKRARSNNEKNKEAKRFGREKSSKKSEVPALLSTKVPKYSTTSKKPGRGKYRSEYTNRGSTTVAPKYIPTIPSVPYVPTVPTITPPRTAVDTTSNQKDDDNEAVISIDVPVKAISSANLVNGDFAMPTANSVSVPLPLVSDGTTEKPVSIIERIINSISSISTTSPPTNTLSSSTASTTDFSSAILKLSPKKSRQTDATDVTKTTDQVGSVTLTTENPTTIIERILSSLNAIQATDITSLAQVGTEFVNSSSFTTTPLIVTKSSTARSLLAPSSTTIIPLSNLDDITSEEYVQKQAISRLLDILNSMVSPAPPNDFVVVTPKSVNKQTGRGPFVSTTIFPPSTYISEFTAANTISTVPSFGTEAISSNLIFSESPDAGLSEINSVAPSTSDVPTTSELSTTAASSESTSSEALLSTSSESTTTDQSVSTESTTRFTENGETTIGSEDNSMTSSITTEPQITSTTETSTIEPTTSIDSGVGTTVTETINSFTLLSSLSPPQKFEVSPGSVSVFSANDIYSNLVTPEYISSTTIVNIVGRLTSVTDNSTTTTTTQSTTTDNDSTTTVQTTTVETTSVPPDETSSGPMQSSTSSANNTQTNNTRTEKLLNSVQEQPKQNSTPSANNTQTNNTRTGKLLNSVQEQPKQNTIDTSTPDYFIFAVLNNNTILRKRPFREPKSSYYVIGVYPNNTVVKKYPNGTVVPMEMTIRVRGFDTRENPPPLPDITSNQVTSDPGSSMDNKNVKTEEQNTIPTVAVTPLSVAPSTSTKLSLPSSNAQNSTTQPFITTTTQSPSTAIESTTPTSDPTTTTPAPTTAKITQNKLTTTLAPSTAEITTTPSATTTPASTTVPTTTITSQNTPALPSTTSTIPAPSLKTNSLTLESQESTTLSTSDFESTTLTSTNSISTITQSTSEASTVVPDMVTVESSTIFTTMGSNSNATTFPTLSELFNGKTIEAFNEIVVNSDNTSANPANNSETGRVSKDDITTPFSQDSTTETSATPPISTIATTTTSKQVDTTTLDDTGLLSNRILEDFSNLEVASPVSVVQRTGIPTVSITTIAPVTSTQPGRIFTNTPPSIIPTFLTTLFPNLFNTGTAKVPNPTTKIPDIIRSSAAPSVSETASFTASTTTSKPPATTTATSRTIAPINITVTTTTTLITTKKPTTLTESTTTARPTTTTTRPTTTTTRPTKTTEVTTTTRPTTTTRSTTTARPTTTTGVTTTTRPTTTTGVTTTTRPTTTTGVTTTTKPATVTTTARTKETTRLTTLIGEAFTTAKTIDVTGFNTVEFTTKSLQLKELTPQQKQNLKAIAQLEKEQAELLNQLSFLTRLIPNRTAKSASNDNRNPKSNSGTSLAERIVALAAERDKAKTTTIADITATSTIVPSTPITAKVPNSIQDQIAALETTKPPSKGTTTALEEVLKGYKLNSVTAPAATSYGKSEDAILASLLKEQGIVPSTPKILAGIFDETTIRPKLRPRTTTTPAPGPLMRGLNWLLNTLAPPPTTAPATRRPTSKPVKPKKPPVEEELLVNSPTHMTPVSTAAPSNSKLANSLSQDDIKKLIKQLEGIQKNPSAETLDLSQLKSIQNLINVDGGVVISANGEHGTTPRRTTTTTTTTTTPTTILSEATSRQPKKPTILPTENSILEFGNGDETVESTTRILRAPIGFNPVPGIDDNNPDAPNSLVRSNLITAAVNVTRAISDFLGTALQGAASSFQTLFGVSSVGTRVLSSAAGGSSAG